MKKTNIANYVINEDGAIINTDNIELQLYLDNREKLRNTKETQDRFEDLEGKVKNLDSKLDLILEKLSNG